MSVTSEQLAEHVAFIERRLPTVAKVFYDRVAKSAAKEAYRYPVADEWVSVTWSEVGDEVSHLAAGLLALGIDPAERVAIQSTTRYEWVVADLAIMAVRGATTTVYPTTLPDEIIYIISDSEAKIVFAEDDVQVAKLIAHRAELPSVTKVIVFDPSTGSGGSAGSGDWVTTLAEVEKLGADFLAEHPDAVRRVVDAGSADDLATLIYTSGTTGVPKGVRLKQSAWTYEGASVQATGILTEDDLQFLWLPMAHAFGKVLLAVQLGVGFPTAVDGRIDKIIDNLPIVRPTFMGAAPRIFEKAYSAIQVMQEAEGGVKKRIFDAAFATGEKVAALRRAGKPIPFPLKLQLQIADRLVFSKIRARFGGRVRFFISGSAALNPAIAEWFDIAGIQILEGYGLTESAAGTFVNRPDNNVIGTVGPPLPGTEVRIAEDGEVLLHGPGVMEGYHNRPVESSESLDDGWLHTGDIGELLPTGQLRITDRKKDLFKTSGGKYIAPSLIESKFMALCPYASQFLVHGNERNFVTALVALDPEKLTDWADRTGVKYDGYFDLSQSPAVHEMVQGYVDQLNLELNRWESIKRFIVLDHDLTVESGDLTPSLKVKRKVVEEKHRELLDSLYA